MGERSVPRGSPLVSLTSNSALLRRVVGILYAKMKRPKVKYDDLRAVRLGAYHFSFCQTAYFSWFCSLCEYCEKCLKKTVCFSKAYALGQIRRPRAVDLELNCLCVEQANVILNLKQNSPRVVVWPLGVSFVEIVFPRRASGARSWKRVPRA